MRSAFIAEAAMNFMRSPDGVMIGPRSRLSRSQVARPVSLLSEPAIATIAARVLPSELIDAQSMFGSRASASIGIGPTAGAAVDSRPSDRAAACRNLESLIMPPETWIRIVGNAPAPWPGDGDAPAGWRTR